MKAATKQDFSFFLGQVRRGAFGFVGGLNGAFRSCIIRSRGLLDLTSVIFSFPSELRVALPDRAPILIGAVPDLAAENTAAVATEDLAGEDRPLTAAPTPVHALQFRLNVIENFLVNDRGMRIFDVELLDLALILFDLLREEVNREGLLQKRVALVLFVREDALDVAGVPVVLAPG